MITNRQGPPSGSKDVDHRLFLFGDAVLLDNGWTAANGIETSRDEDHDIGTLGSYWTAGVFFFLYHG